MKLIAISICLLATLSIQAQTAGNKACTHDPKTCTMDPKSCKQNGKTCSHDSKMGGADAKACSHADASAANAPENNVKTAMAAPKGSETTVFVVSGNCGMCKNRIEKAATVAGVVSATWNAEDQKLTVVYDPQKVKIEAIQAKVAAAGHDTETVKATDKAYKALHGCCQYDRKS